MSLNEFEYKQKELSPSVNKLGYLFLSAGLIIVIISFFIDPTRSSFLSLVMFAFLLSIAIGSVFLIALEYLAGAVWSVPFRRILEYLGYLLFIVPLFALPVIFNLHSLFHWTHQEAVAADAVLKSKAPYLNQTFFIVRLVVIFLIWWVFFIIFRRNSVIQDTVQSQKPTKFSSGLSAIFMPIFAFSLTMIAIDWVMSLEPHWFSTIFGVYYFAGTILAALAAWTFISVTLNEHGYLIKGINEDHYYSLGALLFAFTNFWAYIAFSQFMLIWYANLPEETFWFINRGEGSWFIISLGLILIHFIIPYVLLLSQPSKMDPRRLKVAAVWILFAHFYDLYWMIMPTLDKTGIRFSWNDLGFICLGFGLVVVVFNFAAKNKNMVPIGDPKLKRAMDFHL